MTHDHRVVQRICVMAKRLGEQRVHPEIYPPALSLAA
jgi:hypothetical protein